MVVSCLGVSIPNGPPQPFRRCARSIAWEAAKNKGLRGTLFGGGILDKNPAFRVKNLGVDSVVLASRAMRDTLCGEFVSRVALEAQGAMRDTLCGGVLLVSLAAELRRQTG